MGDKMIDCTDGPDIILEYDPSQSRLVGFTVPNPSSTTTNFKHLHYICDDHGLVTDALKKKNALRGRNAIHLLHGTLCSYESIKDEFQAEAEQVGNEGAFIALFNGHGTGSENGGFVPKNYDGTDSESDTRFITAQVLTELLKGNGNVHPKFVLLIINCCYAGGLARTLFEGSELPSYPVYVITSSEQHEKCFSVQTLEHSIFYYFLAHAIKMAEITSDSTGRKVQLPIKSIFDECYNLCGALTSLLHGPRTTKMTPTLMRTNHEEHGEEHGEQLDPTIFYENPQGEHSVLSQRCRSWIRSCTEVDGGGLSKLSDKGVLKEKRVLNTALCYMLSSAIAIHLDDEIEKATLSSRDYFITVFICIRAAILEVCSEAIIDMKGFRLGLHDYIAILCSDSVCDTAELRKFYYLDCDLKK